MTHAMFSDWLLLHGQILDLDTSPAIFEHARRSTTWQPTWADAAITAGRAGVGGCVHDLAMIDGQGTRRPWWTVNAIFDPDGNGGDFAYTEGLAERGLPELHMWARPDQGEDPGLDWRLSQRDQCGILNRLAWKLVDGTLEVGDTWQELYDEGLVTARYCLGEAVAAVDVEAYGAGDAPVLPVRWSLERPAIGTAAALDKVAQEAAYLEWIEARSRVHPRVPAPEGWRLRNRPSWAPNQRYGPRSELVRTRAAALWSADVDFWRRLVRATLRQNAWRPSGHARAVAHTAARAPGRTSALGRLESDLHELVDGLGSTWAFHELGTVHRELAASDDDPSSAEDLWRAIHAQLQDTIETCLLAEAVADVIPRRMLTLAQGAVRTSQCADERAPADAWLCSEAVMGQVGRLMGHASPGQLIAAAWQWRSRYDDPAFGELEVQRIVGSCHAPAVDLRVEGATSAERASVRNRQYETALAIQGWANALAALLTDPSAVQRATVEQFLSASEPIPGVADRIDGALRKVSAP